MERISFFDEIERNKRNSLLLMLLLFSVLLIVLFISNYVIFGFGEVGVVISIGLAFLYLIVAYYGSSSTILAIAGAKEVSREEQPFLFNVVEGLAMASNIPMPRLYIIEDDSPNAFATGRDPQHAAIAVTSGLLKLMKREELEGVLAHEISHIANYDIRFMTLAVAMVGFIALMGDIILRMIFSGGRNRKISESGLSLLIGMILVILAPFSAELVRFAISREREYLADANGAKLTRYPPGLANALLKIKKEGTPTRSATPATAPLYFVDPFVSKMRFIFATHPPIDERIERLMAM